MKTTMETHETEIRGAGVGIHPANGVLPRLEIVVKPAAVQHVMFSDSLLEFGPQRKRRFFATTTSFVLNALLLTMILALPLMFTEELPKAQLLTFLVAPPPPPPPPPPAAAEQMQRIARLVETNVLSTGGLRTPSRIPSRVQMIKEDEAPPPIASIGGVVGGVPGGVPGGQLGGVIGGIVSATSNLSSLVPKLVPVAPQRVRVSQGITKGLLIHRVEPPYPVLAREARVQGEVILRAVISMGGEIQNLEVISGHPMLVPAAIAAVKEWRYKPYLLNGQPVEVETTITVIFQLSS
jgi:periplasmic protein TonB